MVYEASVTGSVSLLKQLMAEDALTLARAAITCFNETPLHVAAMLGHVDFTKYLLCLNYGSLTIEMVAGIMAHSLLKWWLELWLIHY